jgi:Insertion element 4 transposase N-terminal
MSRTRRGVNTISLTGFLSYFLYNHGGGRHAQNTITLGERGAPDGLLEHQFIGECVPASLIGELLDAPHGNSRRTRHFPATAVAYYCMALSLYPEAAYADVFDAVGQGLAWRRAVPPLHQTVLY